MSVAELLEAVYPPAGVATETIVDPWLAGSNWVTTPLMLEGPPVSVTGEAIVPTAGTVLFKVNVKV